MGISVIICCYNSAAKLPSTLKALSEQIAINDIPCEIILINNNSTDNTVAAALKTWAVLKSPFPLTVVHEKIPGLSHAREKGIGCSKYEYLVFCDDDNWLCKDYLYKVYHLFETLAGVALIGGVGEAILELPAPKWFNELDGFGYAVGAENRQTGYVQSVYGAGMAMRKSVFVEKIKRDFDLMLSDRKGTNLSSGGDTEISVLFSRSGYKIYLDTDLTFRHFIPASRLSWKYYLKLRRSFGKAHAYLSLYNENGKANSLAHGKKHSLTRYLQLAKFMMHHFPVSVFPQWYKNAKSADLSQRLSEKLTYITEHKKITRAAEKLDNVHSNKKTFIKTMEQN